MNFAKKVYGYDTDEVDKYISELKKDYESELDKKKDRLTELVDENRTMNSVIEDLSKQIEVYKQHEEAVGTAIIKAEEAAKATLADAEQKRQIELEKIEFETQRWTLRCDEVRHELTEFEEAIAAMLERYQSEVSYLASKDIKKTYFADPNTKDHKTA